MSPSHAQYLIEVTSPDRAFSDGEFVCRQLTGTEELGRPFEYTLDLLSEDHDFSLEKLLGRSVTTSIELPDGGYRYFNGIVANATHRGAMGRYARYELQLRPWIWFLRHNADSRIFQDMTVPEIIKQVFRDREFSDFNDELTNPPKGSYLKREYCAQYRESDFDFVSRLMEHEGIYYYFKHEKSKHSLVLSDSYSAHEALNSCSKIPYFPHESHERVREHIYGWFVSQEVRTGICSLNSFDFVLPTAELEAKSSNPADHPLAKMEVYDYPGTYLKKAEGEPYAQIRREELQWKHKRANGEGNVRGLAVGGLFTLEDHPRQDQNKEHLVVSADFRLVSNEYEMGATEELGEIYNCKFFAMDAKTPFRPERFTPKPVVNGPQTAIVTGPQDAEIHTDEHGRVKVQFHWDREGQNDEKSSCWIRVAQVWAGKGWGGIFNPRVGQEVIVDFLEGEPDRPLITGRVYNGVQKTPYKLPDDQTKTTIKSHSSSKGTDENFNELRFEDKKDKEEVYFHAEREFNRVVEENDSLKIGMDKQEDGKGDRTVDIWNDRTVTLEKGNDTLQVKTGNREVTIDKGNQSLAILKGDREISVDKGDQKLTIAAGKRTTEIKGDDSLTISQGNYVTKVKMGNHTINVDAGKSSLEAKQSILLKVGQSSVKIDNTGVTIKGLKVSMEGTTKATVKGLMTEVSGDTMLTLKGGVVKIN